jgi:hypothetical protein
MQQPLPFIAGTLITEMRGRLRETHSPLPAFVRLTLWVS